MNLGFNKKETIKKTAQEGNESTDSLMCFSIKDMSAENFGAIFFANTDNEAIRVCKTRLKFDRSLINEFPKDFMLYHVGYFNTKTGDLVGNPIAVPVISLLDVSLQLEKESKSVEIPQFMEGDKQDDSRTETPVCSHDTEDTGKSCDVCN